MPILLPSPEELEAMPWHKRQEAKKKVTEQLLKINPRGIQRKRKPTSRETKRELQEFGEQVREDARRLMDDWNLSDEEVRRNRLTLLESCKS